MLEEGASKAHLPVKNLISAIMPGLGGSLAAGTLGNGAGTDSHSTHSLPKCLTVPPTTAATSCGRDSGAAIQAFGLDWHQARAGPVAGLDPDDFLKYMGTQMVIYRRPVHRLVSPNHLTG